MLLFSFHPGIQDVNYMFRVMEHCMIVLHLGISDSAVYDHLKVVRYHVHCTAKGPIMLEVDKDVNNVDSWFTKGHSRVCAVFSTPDIVELVVKYDAEMSQLESSAQKYIHRKELLRAIDVRLTAVEQDLNTACARASAAGFNHDTTNLPSGAYPLRQVMPYDDPKQLITPGTTLLPSPAIRSSYTSDMSIDDDPTTITPEPPTKPPTTSQIVKKEELVSSVPPEEPLAQTATQPSSRRLSVQDRISLFENKQKEVGSATGSGGKPPAVAKPELRRLSSDTSHANSNASVLRRWSGASDMSIDLSGEKKETDSPKPPLNETPTPSNQTPTPSNEIPTEVKKSQPDSKDETSTSTCRSENAVETSIGLRRMVSEESVGSNQPTSNMEKTRSWSSLTNLEDDSMETRLKPRTQIKSGNQDRFVVTNQQEIRPPIAEQPIEPASKPAALKAPSKNTGSGSKIQEAFAASQHRENEIGSLRSQSRSNNSAETQETDRKQFGESRQNHRDALQRSFSEVVFSDDSRGKFYESYMKKREERLKEQWVYKLIMKSRLEDMHDRSAEIKANFHGLRRHDVSVSSRRRRAERLRSFNARSAMKREQPLDFGQLEDDEDLGNW
ncbi:hypothetical protein Tco_0024231 [Tanacetum coccineum]